MIYWNCTNSLKGLSTSNTSLYTARMGNNDSQNKYHYSTCHHAKAP